MIDANVFKTVRLLDLSKARMLLFLCATVYYTGAHLEFELTLPPQFLGSKKLGYEKRVFGAQTVKVIKCARFVVAQWSSG